MLSANILIKEKRRYPRIGTNLVAQYRACSLNRTQTGLIKDLNSKGLRLISDAPLVKKSSILLELELKELPQILNISGKVAWINTVGFCDKYHVGVEFIDVNKKNENILNEYTKLKSLTK